MGKRAYIFFILILAAMTISAQGNVRNDSIRKSIRGRNRANASIENVQDTVEARFPVSETTPADIDDLQQRPLDLKQPTNIVTDTVYNEKEGTFRLGTRLGESTL